MHDVLMMSNFGVCYHNNQAHMHMMLLNVVNNNE
jgi:hypothetical protein